MARKITPEGKLIELFDSVDVDRAEILLGLARTLLKRKKQQLYVQSLKLNQPKEAIIKQSA